MRISQLQAESQSRAQKSLMAFGARRNEEGSEHGAGPVFLILIA